MGESNRPGVSYELTTTQERRGVTVPKVRPIDLTQVQLERRVGEYACWLAMNGTEAVVAVAESSALRCERALRYRDRDIPDHTVTRVRRSNTAQPQPASNHSPAIRPDSQIQSARNLPFSLDSRHSHRKSRQSLMLLLTNSTHLIRALSFHTYN